MSKITVIGLSGESIFLNVDHFNKKGETVKSNSFHTEPGGKGYNQALALKRLGADVNFITFVGDDIYNASTIKGLKDEEIESYIIKKDGNTAVAVIVTDKTGENNVTVYRGVNDLITFNDIAPYCNVIDQSEFLLLQLEMNIETCYEIIKYAYSKGVKVILNPAPAVKLDKEILKYLYLITPNEHEIKVISDSENIGIERLVVTLGSKGSIVYENGNKTIIPSIKVEAVDTTGAGDIYNASLVKCLAEGKSLIDACKYASIVSGLSVTKKGVVNSIPSIDEIKKVLKNE